MDAVLTVLSYVMCIAFLVGLVGGGIWAALYLVEETRVAIREWPWRDER